MQLLKQCAAFTACIRERAPTAVAGYLLAHHLPASARPSWRVLYRVGAQSLPECVDSCMCILACSFPCLFSRPHQARRKRQGCCAS